MTAAGAATPRTARMRIAYDHRVFTMQPFGGIARYFAETAARVARLPHFDVEVLAGVHLNQYLRGARPPLLRGAYVPHLRGTGRLRSNINDVANRRWLRRRPANLVHETYYGMTSLAPRGTPTVLTVYDMIHERLPELFRPRERTAQAKAAAAQRANRVICISESTRRDLLELIPLDPAKVSVVHLATSFAPGAATGDDAIAAAARDAGAPTVLYVGARAGYKNFDRLLDAFAEGGGALREARLVAFGGGPFTAAEGAGLARRGLTRRATHLGGSDRELAAAYRRASLFVYPSLYEGFGIPILEAMSTGCAVACSDRSSLPEVAGGAAELFDPADPAAMAAAVRRALEPARGAELRALGRARARAFSWDRCAAETAAVYQTAT